MTVAPVISALLYVCEYFFVRGIAVLSSGVNVALLQRVTAVRCRGVSKAGADPHPVIRIAPCGETPNLEMYRRSNFRQCRRSAWKLSRLHRSNRRLPRCVSGSLLGSNRALVMSVAPREFVVVDASIRSWCPTGDLGWCA